jgi:hypothetical protein
MAMTHTVAGLEKLNKRLQAMSKKHGKVRDVIVGYTQPYAVYVHESTGMSLKGVPRRKSRNRPSIGRYWDPPGAQAKFLEKPARQLAGKLGKTIADSMKKGKSFQDAIYAAGLELQFASQKMVPIDFGALIASAFTATEDKLEQVASQAFQKSSMLRPEPKSSR